MRTIKFRGKSVDYGTWRCGSLIIHEDGSMAITGGANEFSSQLWSSQVHPESVGQWTGLVDRHGKEIYEGDVVGFEDATETEGGSYEQNCVGVVEWGEETASFEVTNRLSAESWEVLCECAVIGNLIDSPELMEVE